MPVVSRLPHLSLEDVVDDDDLADTLNMSSTTTTRKQLIPFSAEATLCPQTQNSKPGGGSKCKKLSSADPSVCVRMEIKKVGEGESPHTHPL
jgi:hypothetical protein